LKTALLNRKKNKENSLRHFRMSPKVYDHQKTSVIVRRAGNGDDTPKGESIYVECPICGEMTQNIHHYGGVACDSCKAFFRRTVVNPSKKSERCRIGNRKCILKKERRNNCPFCRFQLCVQTGMKPYMIKPRRSQMKVSISVIKETSRFERMSLRIELTEDEKIEQILMYHQYILTQTAGVNLMIIPAKFLPIVEERLQEGASCSERNEETLAIAQLELHFLKAKLNLIENQRKNGQKWLLPNNSGSLLFTETQEIILEMIIIFLKECKFFQALTWECTSRLLRKNITEITVLLLLMSYDRAKEKFRWRLSDSSAPVEADRGELTKFFSADIAADIFEFVTSFSQLEIPGHVLMVLILICLYSRDGMLMKKQEKIDSARNFYQQLLYRFIKGTNPEDASSRLNATLHRALKTVKDFGEKMRSFKIFHVQAYIKRV